jgi:adenosylcobyric acid synthase
MGESLVHSVKDLYLAAPGLPPARTTVMGTHLPTACDGSTVSSTILVAGTASHVGKSTVAAGLCRLLADRGVDVAPYKAQNMSNNARAVPAPHADEPWGEIGVSQYVQARAARVSPTTDHNPVLLKPSGDGASQLVVDGRPVGTYAASSYYDEHWETARVAAERAHERLADEHEVVVAEGAGSIAEINLHDRDLANVETARFADASVVLVADIERGGVFASLVGTLELMPDDVRERVCGAVVTKFRGDAAILEPGLREFEDRTGVPILGVVPYDDPGLPEEDSVALPAVGERRVVGQDDHDDPVRIGVVRLPRASNVTDVEPLAREPGVRVVYVPPDADLADLDAVVLPGTKNTADDLLTCREAGLGDALADFDGPVVGLCGGYQLLDERIEGASVEGRSDSVGRVTPTPSRDSACCRSSRASTTRSRSGRRRTSLRVSPRSLGRRGPQPGTRYTWARRGPSARSRRPSRSTTRRTQRSARPSGTSVAPTSTGCSGTRAHDAGCWRRST